MLYSGWAFALTALFVFGVYWCYEVIQRFSQDLEEFREPNQNVRKADIIIVWFITVVIAVILLISTVVIITGVTEFVRGM